MLIPPETGARPAQDFSYGRAADGAGLPARVAIFGEDEALRRQITADLEGAGFRSIDGGALRALVDGPIALLGDVVVVDCPVTGPDGIDAMTLASLARLDMRVARSGAKLVVATSLAGLDDVFAVLDQSAPQILVAPSRAEWVIAVGRVMGEAGAARLREMGEEDRLALLHLSQQVEAIARSLDRMHHGRASGGTIADVKRDYRAPEARQNGGFGGRLAADPATGPSARGGLLLPEPQIVRQIIANRQARGRFFDPALFQKFHAAENAVIFADDVQRTAVFLAGQQMSVSFQHVRGDVPERFDRLDHHADLSGGAFAVFTAGVVFGVHEIVLDH
jgi:hypothetical protein